MTQTKNVPVGEVCQSDLEKERIELENSPIIPPIIENKGGKKKGSKPKKLPKINTFYSAKDEINSTYHLRYNDIKLEVEAADIGTNNFKPLNEDNLYCQLRECDIKISKSDVHSILNSDFVKRFDPFRMYFEHLKPYEEGEPDYIESLANYVKADNQEEFNKHFKKHLIRTVKCAFELFYFNKQAFILVHITQNSGKTTFCRFLCPPELVQYFAEDISTDKDGLILLAKNFLINLDELSTLQKAEINALKSYFSKSSINVRLPYQSKNSNIARRASFIGSTNLAQFLSDETGSVRWLCFSINSIDFNYSKDIDINNVWRQAYHLYKQGVNPELTKDEVLENERRNSQFQQISLEEELVTKYFERPNDDNFTEKEFLQSTDITAYLKMQSGFARINIVQIGKVLNKYFEREKRTKDRIQVYGYWVVKI
jgi:predicted P-loop ATPase